MNVDRAPQLNASVMRSSVSKTTWTLMKYELWKYEDDSGVGWTFMPVDHQYEAFLRYKEKNEPSSELVWSIDAETEDEANSRYHEFMGWDPEQRGEDK